MLPSTLIMVNLLYYILVSMPPTVIFTIIGTIVITTFMYLKSFTSSTEHMPHLHYKRSAFANFILKRCSRLTSPFRPNAWLRNGHLQTIASILLPRVDYRYEREYLQMNDKGIIALDWGDRGRKLRKRSPILFVLPGLTAGAVGVGHICAEASRRGFRPVVFNKRGHGGSPLTTPKLQSFGDPSDVRQALKYIRGKFPNAYITAVGFSAGSGLLVSYLGEYGSSSYLTAGVCISPGYDADAQFNGAMKQPYDWLLSLSLKRLLMQHAKALSKVIDVDAALRSKTLVQFEELVYCKLNGYENMEQYWEKNNPNRDIDDVAIPVLCINSIDDPVCSKELIPYELFKVYPNLMLVVTEYGGHCGFLEGPKLDNWADKAGLDFIEAVMDFIAKGFDKL